MSENTYHSTIANENIAIDSVTKRDGTLAPFDSNKIYNAIKKRGDPPASSVNPKAGCSPVRF